MVRILSFYFHILVNMTRVFMFVLLILLIVSFTESSRCSKKCSFEKFQLNSSIPLEFCSSTIEFNNSINQACKVKLTIDFITDFVNGSFDVDNQLSTSQNYLDITTIFSLNAMSTKVEIIYLCIMSDYCDVEVVPKTLWSILAALRLEPLRQNLSIRLYNPNNTHSIICLKNITCPQNVSLCHGKYEPPDEVYPEGDHIWNRCADPNAKAEVSWNNYYQSDRSNPITSLVLNCNNPRCLSYNSLTNTFNWLVQEYRLPIRASMFDITTTPKSTITLPITATRNYASFFFGHFNCLIFFVLTVLVLQLYFSEMF